MGETTYTASNASEWRKKGTAFQVNSFPRRRMEITAMKTPGKTRRAAPWQIQKAWNFPYRKDETESQKPKQHHDISIREVRREKGKGKQIDMIISRNKNCLRVSQHLLVAILRSWVAATCSDMLYCTCLVQYRHQMKLSLQKCIREGKRLTMQTNCSLKIKSRIYF